MSVQICEQRTEGVLVIGISGRLDGTNSDDAARELLAPVDRGESRLVLDVSQLHYVSSTGLRVFLLVAKRIKAADGKVALCGLTDMVKEIFTIAGFTELFPHFPSSDHAVKAVK